MRMGHTSKTVFAVLLIAAGLGVFVQIGKPALKAFAGAHGTTVAKRFKEVRDALSERFPGRYAFVSLNGLWRRMIGSRRCNGVIAVGPERYLVKPNRCLSGMRSKAKRMIAFSDFCKTNAIAFVYVQVPKRIDVGQAILPPGSVDCAQRNADNLMAELRKAGVETMDLRRTFAETPEQVLRNFYRTDPHWNNDAAFAAAGLFAQELVRRCGMPAKMAEMLNRSNWKRHELPLRFLGGYGRRTGPLFAGFDRIVAYVPTFETAMTLTIPSKGISCSGTFEETNMRRLGEMLTTGNPYQKDLYSMLYVGGIYPIVEHENPKAPGDIRVLIIGDSAVRPVEAFLSTVVKRLVVVDPRRCKPGFTLAECVLREKPSIVFQVMNPSSLVVDTFLDKKTGKAVMFEYGL